MAFQPAQGGRGSGGFLPEDYLKNKAAMRTNLIGVGMFLVVTLGVVGAFFVTNRQWNDVRAYQASVNERYSTAAAEIEQLKELEVQEGELLDKAELTAALIERVPRTTLLAELINRGPDRMTLIEVEVRSERTDRKVQSRSKKAEPKAEGLSTKKQKSSVRKTEEENVILAPQYETSIKIIGVAPRNQDVAAYLRGLQQCDLLRNVEMIQSAETIINNRLVYEFRIEADLDQKADARSVEPAIAGEGGEGAAAFGGEIAGVAVEEDNR
jgi:Tfp pilus assembly protein PilN